MRAKWFLFTHRFVATSRISSSKTFTGKKCSALVAIRTLLFRQPNRATGHEDDLRRTDRVEHEWASGCSNGYRPCTSAIGCKRPCTCQRQVRRRWDCEVFSAGERADAVRCGLPGGSLRRSSIHLLHGKSVVTLELCSRKRARLLAKQKTSRDRPLIRWNGGPLQNHCLIIGDHPKIKAGACGADAGETKSS